MDAARKIMALLFEYAGRQSGVRYGATSRRALGWGYFARAIAQGLTVDETLEIVGPVYILGWERPEAFFTDQRLNVHLGYELQRAKGLPCRESYVKGARKNRYPNVTAQQRREVWAVRRIGYNSIAGGPSQESPGSTWTDSAFKLIP